MTDDGGAAESKGVTAPPRPTISLPPRSTFESFFRGGADVSPGPMTLVSSFFNEDPENECRSFSQLLAGAMMSPVAAAAAQQQRRPPLPPPSAAEEDGSRQGRGIVCENRPTSLTVSQPQSRMQSPFFMVPTGLSPGGLLESPAIFPPNLVSVICLKILSFACYNNDCFN